MLLAVVTAAVLATSYCSESPVPSDQSLSLGAPAHGHLLGAVQLKEGALVRVLPLRHKSRCLSFGTERLVSAIERAAAKVHAKDMNAPPLGVGDIARAHGGPIPEFSHSHQSGRDADLAFFQTDKDGRPVAAEDLTHFGKDLIDSSGQRRFDTARNWELVSALLGDKEIHIHWIFVSAPLRTALLEEAKRQGAAKDVLARAEEVLHQPSDAPPHDDHFHLRIDCTAEERAKGCRG